MTVKRVSFADGEICVLTSDGQILRQPLSRYPHLQNATNSELDNYYASSIGLHWRGLDTDISFESFFYPQGATALMYMG